MNINASQAAMLSLHKQYNYCLQEKMSSYLRAPGNAAPEPGEWCVQEKSEYLHAMKDNLPTEYENLIKLEQNNF